MKSEDVIKKDGFLVTRARMINEINSHPEMIGHGEVLLREYEERKERESRSLFPMDLPYALMLSDRSSEAQPRADRENSAREQRAHDLRQMQMYACGDLNPPRRNRHGSGARERSRERSQSRAASSDNRRGNWRHWQHTRNHSD